MTVRTESMPDGTAGSILLSVSLLGFAIGGFFDGILLHQVLQWHHLLSGLEGGRFGDLRFQILADGLFHLLMYAIALFGLYLLWRARGRLARHAAGRMLLAYALIGFGAWHILDGIVSHWVLGIHRIRMDSEAPLFWDLLWFIVFGVLFVAAGLLLRRRGGEGGGRGGAVTAALAVAAALMGIGASLPPGGDSPVLVVFRQDVSEREAFSALASVGGRLVWSDAAGQVWAVALPDEARTLDLYRSGALLVSRSILPAGCLDWSRI